MTQLFYLTTVSNADYIASLVDELNKRMERWWNDIDKEVPREKPVPVPLSPSQIPHG